MMSGWKLPLALGAAISLTSLIVSTIAFFVASFLAKRWADDNDLPKGMTRGAAIFAVALLVAYGAAWLVDHLIH